jgi:non-ribosomal peptide synthetase component F
MFEVKKAATDTTQKQFNITPYEYESGTTIFDIDWTGTETDQGIEFVVVYSSELFTYQTMQFLAEAYLMLIKECIDNPCTVIGDLKYTQYQEVTAETEEVTFNF